MDRNKQALDKYNQTMSQYKAACIKKGYMNEKGAWLPGGQEKAYNDNDITMLVKQANADFQAYNRAVEHTNYQAKENKNFDKQKKELEKRQKQAYMRGLNTKLSPEELEAARKEYDSYTSQLGELQTKRDAMNNQSTDDYHKQKEEQAAIEQKQKEEQDKEDKIKQDAQDELDKMRNKEIRNKVGNAVGKGIVGMVNNFTEAMQNSGEMPEANDLRERMADQSKTAAELEERTNISKGESNRNVEALASGWTETAANNAANVAASAQGGDTGAGAAIARMQAAQDARDKEGAANLQKAQERKDKYEHEVGTRAATADAAKASLSETKLQFQDALKQYRDVNKHNREADKIQDDGMLNIGAGPTVKEMDGNKDAPPPTEKNVANGVTANQQQPVGNHAGQATQTNPQSDARTQNAATNQDATAIAEKQAILQKVSKGEVLTENEVKKAQSLGIQVSQTSLGNNKPITSKEDPTLIRKDKEKVIAAMYLPGQIIDDSGKKLIIDTLMKLHGTSMDRREQAIMEELNHLKNDYKRGTDADLEMAKKRWGDIQKMCNTVLGGK